ncbi:hypothetical protein TraAM80_06045 [Trypanosoma rangeli]|uniref:B30.2/SPRY domain-containing protein n=1 Tax=Trypanosoma rangeli TaxID=5698 RepID=A0A3R7MIA8_TRYRA|nr:uncharacterized protein TraAM80_06045 [Trypanosoma rangeli]RNF02995.1 hypothetical protein TraAM80_06045 [Trypanosoma rangeli]|eukprot:RNF02995.1 hypothetical protein TraAM80_06045 [Trypanosoma rangeli]
MDNPLVAPDSSPVTFTVYSNCDTSLPADSVSVNFGQVVLSDIMAGDHCECNDGDLENAEEDVWSVPPGDAQATQECGWNSKYNPKKNALLCIREENATAFLLKEEYIARCLLEVEEVGQRGLLSNAIQWELHTLCGCNAGVMRDNGQTGPLSHAQASNPVFDTTANDNELFLRNTRLRSILDDEAFTPLEKLLRDSSPNAPPPSKLNNPAIGGAYANIYEPPSGVMGSVPAQTPSGTFKVGLRAKNVPQPSFSEADPSYLSSGRLLETQRHQLEMERRLTRRERDTLERALDARYKCIQFPPDTYAQLRYEPSNVFSRERQLILGSLGISDPKASQTDAATPLQEESKKKHIQQQQQKQQRVQSQVHKEGIPSAGVSPISSHTFLFSPSPSKVMESKPDPKGAALFSEACEAKYKEGLTAMKELLDLYQTFIRTQPQPNPAPSASQSDVSNSFGNEPTTPSTITYEKRLARIKRLYPSTGTNASVVHQYRCLLRTPPLPPSLGLPTVPGDIGQHYANAPVKGYMIPFQASSTGASNTGTTHESGLYEYHLLPVNNSCTSGRSVVRQEAQLKPFIGSENDGDHDTLNIQYSDTMLPPHRRIITPPVPSSREGQISTSKVSVTWPVLRWDAERSENVCISQNGTTCVADVSRALQLSATEKERTGKALPSAKIAMFALGTIGIAEGEFIFEVRIDARPSLTHTPQSLFAVGVTTKYYRGSNQRSPAYLFRSDGTLVSHSDDETRVPYGSSYNSGAHITVYLSLIQKELCFFLNGKALGAAFRFRGVEDPEPLFPLVVLGDEGCSATFVPPSQLLPQVSSSARQSMRPVRSH